jgi:bacteriocin-like protein
MFNQNNQDNLLENIDVEELSDETLAAINGGADISVSANASVSSNNSGSSGLPPAPVDLPPVVGNTFALVFANLTA